MTTNLTTPALFAMLRGGYLNRAERTAGTVDTNKAYKPDYQNPQYAYTRDITEQRLHQMPPMHPHFVSAGYAGRRAISCLRTRVRKPRTRRRRGSTSAPPR